MQAPGADVHALVNLTERARGTATPRQLTFTAANWALPQARGRPTSLLCSCVPDERVAYQVDWTVLGALRWQVPTCCEGLGPQALLRSRDFDCVGFGLQALLRVSEAESRD